MLNLKSFSCKKSKNNIKELNKNVNFITFLNLHNEDELITIMLNCLKDSETFYHNYVLLIKRNKFIGKKNKKLIENLIFLGKRRMFLFQKYLKKWIHHNKYIYKNDCDLLLSKLDNKTEYPKIYENKYIYRFSKNDIHNLIVSNVVYGEYQIPRILPIKNPWTNSVLSKIQLYNLFISSNSTNKIPWIFKEYALCNFDPNRMIVKHRSYLTEEAIKQDLNNLSETEFRNECEKIFKYNIASLFLKTGKFHYNSLKSVDFMILKQYFKPIVLNAYIYSRDKIFSHEKLKLYKLLELYPSIIVKKTNCKHTNISINTNTNTNTNRNTNINTNTNRNTNNFFSSIQMPFFQVSIPSFSNFYTIEFDQNMDIDTYSYDWDESYENLD